MQFYKINPRDLPKDEEVLFIEVQRFTQVWLWIFLIILLLVEVAIFGYGIVKQIIFREPWGDKPLSDVGLMLITIWAVSIPVIVLYLFSITHLEVRVYPSGLYMRYFPFHIKYRYIPWDTIDEVVGKKYSPIGEYGGWGIRWNFNSWAYTVRGNYCIELRKGKKKVVIGTQKLAELLNAMNRAQEIYLQCNSKEE